MLNRMILALGAALLAGTAMAQDADPDPSVGGELFRSYCAQCHGGSAEGNGPMAELIAISTPDLTQLAARNGGVFPTEAVARQIDGRARTLAHGGDMPIFGPFLDSDEKTVFRLSSGQPMMTGLPIADLVVYLESIQVE